MKNRPQDQQGKNKPNDQQNKRSAPDNREKTKNPSGKLTNTSSRNSGSIGDFTEGSSDTGRNAKDTPANRAQVKDQPLNRDSSTKGKGKDNDEQEYKNKKYPHERSTPKADDDDDDNFGHIL